VQISPLTVVTIRWFRFEAPLDRHVDAHVSVALRIVREVIAKLGHDPTDRLDRTEGDVSGRAVPSRRRQGLLTACPGEYTIRP
jgi:hypothetical protein